jgi:predicted nucleic acid-binding protein
MTGYLIDTNVVSEPTHQDPNPGAMEWLGRAAPDECYLSVITLGELHEGVERLRLRGKATKARALGDWLDSIAADFADRVVPIGPDVAAEWGRLRATGRTLPTSDSLLAATALVHGFTVVTRNVADFADTGARILNPFE